MTFVRRDLYLRIEPICHYNPLSPVATARRWGRDALYNPGHEYGRIVGEEMRSATLDALVYREFTDSAYEHPVRNPIIAEDLNEPPWNRRVPGAVLYASPGERLHIHLLNCDRDAPHSFHVHGLRYGADSDGTWPLGLRNKDGRRSDAIRYGEEWTYVYEITEEMIGAWPFHDHARNVGENVNRGLFGGLIVRDPAALPAVEAPLFVHLLEGAERREGFESPVLSPGQSFTQQFASTPTTYAYYCRIHGRSMSGTVVVAAEGPPSARVAMRDIRFDPAVVVIGPGGFVIWTSEEPDTHHLQHIVASSGMGGPTLCLNGRAFVGNTPTIEVSAGERIRWYLFNLDLSEQWHNFHQHAARWWLPGTGGSHATPVGPAGRGGENGLTSEVGREATRLTDVHPLSPTQAAVVETFAPPVLLPDAEPPGEATCDGCPVTIKGDFIFHCHVEHHMMRGLAGLVRSVSKLCLTEELLQKVSVELPLDDGENDCPPLDLAPGHCAHWQPAPVDLQCLVGSGAAGEHGCPVCGEPSGCGHEPEGHGHDDHARGGAEDMPPGCAGAGECCDKDLIECCDLEEMELAGAGTAAPDPARQEQSDHDHETAGNAGAAPAPGHSAHGSGQSPAPVASIMREAAARGVWELLPWEAPVLAVHAALMHTGRVLFISGSAQVREKHAAGEFSAAVWDPPSGHWYPRPSPFDFFCAGHAFLADGQLLVAGGTRAYVDGNPFYLGLETAALFRPDSTKGNGDQPAHPGEWLPASTMHEGRWYPSLVTLPDGRVLAVAGYTARIDRNLPNYVKQNRLLEIFTPATGTWDKGTEELLFDWPTYPHLFVLDDGKVFFTGGNMGGGELPPLILDPQQTARQAVIRHLPGLRDADKRDQSSSILLPPAQDQRVMIVGGGVTVDGEHVPSSDKVDIVDFGPDQKDQPHARYRPGPPLHTIRMHLNAVLLPDRTVCVVGGGQASEHQPALDAEIYDARENCWRRAARATVPRLYHSVAVLLPDGRVLTAGSNPEARDEEYRLEIFHPPYLFRGPRPFIMQWPLPRQFSYGQEFRIHTPQARDILWAQLIRPMATTHSFDTEQRLVDLPIHQPPGFCHLDVTLADNPALAPPGWYMLFITTKRGVPSVARWLRLGPEEEKR